MKDEKKIWDNLKTEIHKYQAFGGLGADKKKLFSSLINSFIAGYKKKNKTATSVQAK